MSNAARDGNRVPTLIGVSSLDMETVTRVAVNPATGAMLIDGDSLHTNLDLRYLKLAADNDPLTDDLQLQKGGDNLHLYIDVHSTDNTDYPRLYFRKSDSNSTANITETDSGDWLGNIKYLGVNDSGEFAGGAYLTVKQTGASGSYVPTQIEWATYSTTGENANSLVIDSSGNVGFGEESPVSSFEITKPTPGFTLHNTTVGDADGARASFIDFRGHQSGDEESQLARIEASHDGAGDDASGVLKFYTNEGGLNERMSISSNGVVQIGSLNFDTNVISSDTDLISFNAESLISINAINLSTDNTANYFLMADGTYYNATSPANARTGLGLTSGGAGDIWVEKAGDTMTGTLQINVPTTTTEALILKTTDDNATKNVFEIQNSAGGVNLLFNNNGVNPQFRIMGSTTATFDFLSSGIVWRYQANSTAWSIRQATAETDLLTLTASSSANRQVGIAGPVLGATLGITSAYASTPVVKIKAAASQTANLTEWQDSSGANLGAISSAGDVGFGVAPNAAYKLHVTGNTRLDKVITTTYSNVLVISASLGGTSLVGYGISGNIYNLGTTTNIAVGCTFNAWHQSASTATSMIGNDISSGIASTGAGNVTNLISLRTTHNLQGAGNATNAIGINVTGLSQISTGRATNVYGIKIEDLTLGTSTNYAIYTGAGIVHFGDKVQFTQTDGNEAIDSLNDGYMDYLATTAHRFNNDLIITGNNITLGDGSAGDPRITFDSGNDAYIEWQEDELQFHIDGALEMGGDWTFVGGSFFPRTVDDDAMDATDGTEGEIVYNQDDNKFYGCTTTGTPATWAAFN